MSFRTILSTPFFAGLVIGVAATGAAADMPGSAVFPDVQPGSYYDASVGRLYGAGIIKGGGDGKFNPGNYVTRAEIAVMLDRALNTSTALSAGGDAAMSVSRRSSSSSSSVSTPASSVSSSSSVSTAVSSSSSSVSVSSVATSASSVVGPAGAFRFSSDKIAFPESASNVSLSITRYGGTKGSVSVRYTTGDGTAKSTVRYNQATGVVSFADGETTKIISLKFINNLIAEPNETFTVTLSEATGGAVVGTPSAIVVTVLDNDGGGGNATGPSSSSSSSSAAGSTSGAAGGNITFSAWSYSADESAGSVTVTVLRKGNTSSAVSVGYATAAGTATVGVNYNETQGTLSFAAGETSKTFTVQFIDNTSIDGNKSATVKLSSPTGGAALDTPNSVPLTIVDGEANSAGSGTVSFSSDSYSATEKGGLATVTVVRRVNFAGTVTVNYATGDSTATGGSDYTPATGTLTFAPFEAGKSFTVTVTKDTLSEGEEKINLTLSSPSGNASLGIIPTSVIKIQD